MLAFSVKNCWYKTFDIFLGTGARESSGLKPDGLAVRNRIGATRRVNRPLKTIDTIVKTHDKESIFSWDAFKMCSIDLTNFHSMLTELSDKY